MGRNSASVKVGDGLRAISIKELVDSLLKQFRESTNSLIDRQKNDREPKASTADKSAFAKERTINKAHLSYGETSCRFTQIKEPRMDTNGRE
jgi:hypothetical protein